MSATKNGSWTIVRRWLHEGVIAALTVGYKQDDYSTARYVFVCGKDGLVPTGHRGEYEDQDAMAAGRAAARWWFDGGQGEADEVKLKGWTQ